MSDPIKLNYQTAQLLLSAASSVLWPARLGASNDYALVFPDEERADKMHKIAELRASLRAISHRREDQWCVGNAVNWRQKLTEPGRWEIIDKYLELEIRPSDLGASAIYWLCLWMAHPGSPAFQNGGIQDEVIYPMVERLGQIDDLMYDLGLIESKPEIPVRQSLTAAPAGKKSNGSH